MNRTPKPRQRRLRLVGIAAGADLLATPQLRAQASSCATVHSASLKMEATPYHMYFVDSAKAVEAENGGKPKTVEAISVGAAMYLLSHGKRSTRTVPSLQRGCQRSKAHRTRKPR